MSSSDDEVHNDHSDDERMQDNDDIDEDENDNEEERVEVTLTTDLPEQYHIQESSLLVPVKLSRYGLSELVNYLLTLDQPKPFDFLIDQEFLRTSLRQYMKKNNLTSERVINIEYTFAVSEPEIKGDLIHDDWVSATASLRLNLSSDLPYCLSGSYDGVIRLWNTDNLNSNWESKIHKKAIKSIVVLDVANNKDSLGVEMLVASMDHTISRWKADISSKALQPEQQKQSSKKKGTLKDSGASARRIHEFIGHSASVESIAVDPANRLFCSGGWDNKVNIWNLKEDNPLIKEEPVSDEDDEDGNRTKRRKIAQSPQQAPQVSLDGHTGCVSGVGWMDRANCVSGSWDQSIRIWDLSAGAEATAMRGYTAINCISVRENSGLILSGHPDNAIRLWDGRSREGEVIKRHFRSHKQWVSQVVWHPTSEYLFASVSHDAVTRVWDTRSTIPIMGISLPTSQKSRKSNVSLATAENKLLCVAWHGPKTVMSGGSDSRLHVHQFAAPLR